VYEKDGIVYADDPKPVIKVKSVRANDDYSLFLRFSDGTEKTFDAKSIMDNGVFKQLHDLSVFKQAYVDFGTVVWNESLDICPDYFYANSI
jgi:hypothetical protein